jgi:hypothetical protein
MEDQLANEHFKIILNAIFLTLMTRPLKDSDVR